MEVVNDNLKKYYDYLVTAKADVPGTYESFQKTLSDEASAKQYYKYLKDSKLDAPDTFESFSETLGLKKKVGSEYVYPTSKAFTESTPENNGSIAKDEATTPQTIGALEVPVAIPKEEVVKPSVYDEGYSALTDATIKGTHASGEPVTAENYITAAPQAFNKRMGEAIRNIGELINLPQSTMLYYTKKFGGKKADAMAKYLEQSFKDNPMIGAFSKENIDMVASAIENAGNPKPIPENLAGSVLSTLGSVAFDMLTVRSMPTSKLNVLAKYDMARVPMFPTYLATMQGTTTAREGGGAKKTAVSTAEGLASGLTYEGMGITAGRFGEMVQKLAGGRVGKAWVEGAIKETVTGKQVVKTSSSALANATLFEGDSRIKGGEKWVGAITGIMFSAPEFKQDVANIVKQSVAKRAYVSYLTTTDNAIRNISKMNLDPVELRKQSDELWDKYEAVTANKDLKPVPISAKELNEFDKENGREIKYLNEWMKDEPEQSWWKNEKDQLMTDKVAYWERKKEDALRHVEYNKTNKEDPYPEADIDLAIAERMLKTAKDVKFNDEIYSAEELLAEKTAIDNIINVNAMTQAIIENPTAFLNEIKKDQRLSDAEKAKWTDKIRSTVNFADPRIDEAMPIWDKIAELKQSVKDAETLYPDENVRAEKVSIMEEQIKEQEKLASKTLSRPLVAQPKYEMAGKPIEKDEALNLIKQAENVEDLEGMRIWNDPAVEKALEDKFGEEAIAKKAEEKKSIEEELQPIESISEAEMKLEQGEEVYAMHEQGGDPIRIENVSELNSFSLDQLSYKPGKEAKSISTPKDIAKENDLEYQGTQNDIDGKPMFDTYMRKDNQANFSVPVGSDASVVKAEMEKKGNVKTPKIAEKLSLGDKSFTSKKELFDHLEKTVPINKELNQMDETWFDREIDSWPSPETVKAINEWSDAKKAELKAKRDAVPEAPIEAGKQVVQKEYSKNELITEIGRYNDMSASEKKKNAGKANAIQVNAKRLGYELKEGVDGLKVGVIKDGKFLALRKDPAKVDKAKIEGQKLLSEHEPEFQKYVNDVFETNPDLYGVMIGGLSNEQRAQAYRDIKAGKKTTASAVALSELENMYKTHGGIDVWNAEGQSKVTISPKEIQEAKDEILKVKGREVLAESYDEKVALEQGLITKTEYDEITEYNKRADEQDRIAEENFIADQIRDNKSIEEKVGKPEEVKPTKDEKPNEGDTPISKGEENIVPGGTENDVKPVETKGEEKPIRTTDPAKQKQIEAIDKEYDAKITDAQKELAGMTEDARQKVIDKASKEIDKRNTLFGDAEAVKDGVLKPGDQGFDVSRKPIEEATRRFDERKVELTKQVDALNKERESKIGEVLKQQTLGFEETPNPIDILSPGLKDADKLYPKIEKDLAENGSITIQLNDGTKIENVKAIGKWGEGLYYGFKKGQKDFDKSVSMSDVVYPSESKPTTSTLNDAVSKYGWSAVKNPEGYWLQNKDGKPVVKVVQKKDVYQFFDMTGNKLMDGRGQIEKSAEKLLKDYYYAKEVKVEPKITDKELTDLFPDDIVSVKLKDGTTQDMSFRGWDKGKAIVYNKKVGQFPVEKSDIIGVTKKARPSETPAEGTPALDLLGSPKEESMLTFDERAKIRFEGKANVTELDRQNLRTQYQRELDRGYLKKYVEEGRMTQAEADAVLESAGLKAPIKETPKSELYTQAEKIVSGSTAGRKFSEMTDLINKSKDYEGLKSLLELPYIKKDMDLPKEVQSRLRYLERHPEVAEVKAESTSQGIKFKDKTYTEVDQVMDALDKGEITFEESKQLREDVNKFEEGLKAEAKKVSDDIANRVDKGMKDINDKVKKDIIDENGKLSVKLLPPDIISKGNTALWKQLVKVRDTLANGIAKQLGKGVISQNNAIRWSTKTLTNLYAGLLRTQADMFGTKGTVGKLEMQGTIKAYAPHKALDLLGEWRKVVNSDPEALRRVLDVLDPDPAFAIEKLAYGDLSVAEKKLYFTMKEWNTWVWSTNYANGLIPTESHLKFKGDFDATGYSDYIARMYDAYEEGTILSPEIQEFISRGNSAVTSKLNTDYMKMREETNEWKKEHAIRDPTYLTAKRVMQTIQNVAVKQYMDMIVAEHPEFVVKLKKGEEVPKGFTKLGASYSWGPLRNRAVANHIVEDFTGFYYQNAITNTAYDLVKMVDRTKLNQFYKKYRTVYNPFVQTGNITGNVFFASINGINPFQFVKGMVDNRNLHTTDPALYDQLLKSGLIGDTAITGEMKPADILKTTEGALSKADDLATKAYVGSDNLAKISAYQIYRKQGLSHEQAVRRTYDAFQNYATVGKTWDIASKIPLVGPTFIKFQADLQRILANSMLTTPLTTIGTLLMVKMLGNLSSALSGETEEEQELREARKGVPRIPIVNIPLSFKVGKSEVNVARYLSPLYLYNRGDSEMELSELSKFMPIQFQKKEEGKMFPLPAFADATWGWLGSVATDRDFRGMTISDPKLTKYNDPNTPTDEKIFNVLNYIARSQVPFYKGTADIVNAATGQLDYYGRKRTWEQAILNQVIKIQQFDKPELKTYVERNLNYLTSKYASLATKMGDAQGVFYKTMKDAEDKQLSPEAQASLYASASKLRDKSVNKSLEEQIPVYQEIERLTSVYKKWNPEDPFIKENFQNIESGKNQRFNVLDGIDLQKKYPKEYSILKTNDMLKKPEIPKFYKGEALTEAEKKAYSNIYWSEYIRILDGKDLLTQENIDIKKDRIARREKADTEEGMKEITKLQDIATDASARAKMIAEREFRKTK